MKYLIQLSKLIIICLVFLPINSCANPRDPSKDSLALDKSIRVGHLPNGFTYYIKPTSDTDKINLRFYVKVGFLNEKFPEKDFAHLAEHLGYHEGYQKANQENDIDFNNSATYSSAGTANVHTEYYSSLASDDSLSLNRRLQWFANISDLKAEDSVVRQEARCLRQELFARARGLALDRSFNESVYKAAIFFDKEGESPYTNWLTTYDMGGISVPSLREFYRHWYQPDRMGLVITGNIQDIDNLEQQLVTLYNKIPKRKVQREGFDIRQFYLSAPPRFKTVEKKEVNRFSGWNSQNSEISLIFRVKNFHKELNTKEKWLNEQLHKAMYRMIYKRLKEKGTPSGSSEEKGLITAEFPDRNHPYFRMPSLEDSPGTERENIQRVTSILQLLQYDGFTEPEWELQKQRMLNRIIAKDTSSTKYWEKQLENHFVYGEILPAQKKGITQKWIDSLTLEDINSYLSDNFSVMPDDIYITASSGHPALLFTEKQVRGWIKKAIKNPVDLRETIETSSLTPVGEKNPPFMSSNEVERLRDVGYKKTGTDPGTGLEILELDNGVKLMLDWQEPKNNVSERVLITGTSPRGASCFPENKYYSAISATEIVKLSGAGSYTRKEIRNKFGKELRPSAEPVQLHILNNNSTVRTRAKLKELEKYLQLIYLYFTSPKNDSLAFVQWQNQIRQRYLDNTFEVVNPMGTDMGNAIADYLGVSCFKAPAYVISTEQYYQKQNVKLDKAMECYQAIFSNASDFTFVVKGKYEKKEVLSLLQKYLGNLPTENHTYSRVNKTLDKAKAKLPKGPIYHTFYADKMGTAYKLYTTPYALSYVFTIPENKWKDRVVLDLINTYLLPKVRFEFRYRKGISLYDAYTRGKYSETNALYGIAIFVNALEDELELIRSESRKLITNLKNHGISMKEKDRVLKNPLFFGRYSASPKFQEKVMRYVCSLTSEDIKKVAVSYLKEDNQYEFVFMENKEK